MPGKDALDPSDLIYYSDIKAERYSRCSTPPDAVAPRTSIFTVFYRTNAVDLCLYPCDADRRLVLPQCGASLRRKSSWSSAPPITFSPSRKLQAHHSIGYINLPTMTPG